MTNRPSSDQTSLGGQVPRRRLLAGVAGGAAMLAAGCSSNAGSSGSSSSTGASGGSPSASGTGRVHVNEKVTLHYWNWLPSDAMKKATALFNKAHPNIQVVSESVKPGSQGSYQKMQAAVKAGNPPELAHVEYIILPQFLTSGSLMDISQYAKSAEDQFIPWQWSQCVFGGKVYSVPWASGPMGLFYRWDLYKKYGISVPKTWKEFKTAAQTVRKKAPKSYLTSFGPKISPVFNSLAWQAGARWYKTKGNKWIINVDGSDTMKVANYWQDMIDNKLVSTQVFEGDAFWKAVQDGTIMTIVGADWDDALIKGNAKNTAGKWRTALLPQWSAGQHVSANYGGSSTAILKGCKHPKEAVEAAIWLNTNLDSLNIQIQGGVGWPAAKKGVKAPALSKKDPFFDNTAYQKVFVTSDKHVSETWQWGPTSEETQTHINDAMKQVINDKTTLPAVMRKAQKQTISDVKGKGLPVASA